jgi:hypothetical protein
MKCPVIPRRFIFIFIFIFIVVISLILTACAPAEAGLTVSGGLLWTNVTPGQHISHIINVSTDKTDPSMEIRAVVNGFGQKLDGANDELPAELDVSPYSARTFLNVTPNSFSLMPGDAKEITLNVDVPQDIGEGGKYALVNIYSPPIDIGILSVVIAVDVPVVLTSTETEQIKKGEIAALEIGKPISARQQNVSIILKNTGNYHYKAFAEAILKDEMGKILANASSPVSLTSIIPFSSRLFSLSLVPRIPLDPGTYYVNATVRLENNTIIANREADFTVAGGGK